ncbi:unnamed protein product [Mycena citricolor]|uniref:DUF6534 domain-containing protein n=1 Tax=Mycena citricolor TaxID=2018698 RepID=A0AAD2GXR7_9AGAR|nr:unnamed protein product [Mycena citricolor]CAK5265035.1 unnamed protein product [Mycena citricolor]
MTTIQKLASASSASASTLLPTILGTPPSAAQLQMPTTIPTAVVYQLPDYTPIVTPQLIGSLLNFFFVGTLLIQVYVYRICFPLDSILTKGLVYFVSLLILVSICLNAADVEFWYGSGFGKIARFADSRNSRFYTPLAGSLIAMLVQFFFAYRIVVIRKVMWPLAVLVGLAGMAQCAGGIGGAAVSYMAVSPKHDHERTILVYLWLAGGAAAALLVTVVMIPLSLSTEAKGKRTVGGTITSVARLSVETNAVASVVALLGLLLFVCAPNTTYFVCPVMILPGIYANTLLVALNNRSTTLLTSDVSTIAPRVSSRAPLSSTNSGPLSFAPRNAEADDIEEIAVSIPNAHVLQRNHSRNSVTEKWRRSGRGEDDSDSEYGSDAGIRERA